MPEQRPYLMSLILRSLALLLFLLSPLTSWGDTSADKPLKLTILSFNDPHAHYRPFPAQRCDGKIGGFARLKAALDRARAEAQSRGRLTLTLLAGDLLTGTIYSNEYKGEMGVELLNRMNLTAMTVGNHEFDYGFDNLINNMKPSMEFPLLSANIFAANGKPLFRGKIERSLKDGALKLVILGLTTEYTPKMSAAANVKGLVFKNAVTSAKSELSQYSDKDLIIALTHLGIDYDRKLASACPKIDVIVGGHSHTAIIQPENEAKTIIIQAGAYTRYLGILDIDLSQGRIVNYKAGLKPLTANVPPDRSMEELIADYTARLPKGLSEPIAKTEILLDAGRAAVRSDRNSLFGKLIAGAMATRTSADAALINGGAIRKSVCPGEITALKLREALPYNNKVVIVKLKGEDLLRVMERSASQGFGSGAKLQRYGLDITWKHGSPVIKRVGGRKFQRDKVYRIAINDFIANGGDGYSIFKEKGLDMEVTDMETRQILADYLKNHGPVTMDLVNEPR